MKHCGLNPDWFGFDALDTDKDGSVTLDEFLAYVSTAKGTNSAMKSLFDDLDEADVSAR